MTTVLLIIHMFVTIALIGVVLIQRSEGGGLGIGTSQGMGGFMSGRGTTNLLTRTTAVLGAVFFGLSLALALMNRGTVGAGRSLLDTPVPLGTSAPTPSSAPLNSVPVPTGTGAGPTSPTTGPTPGPTTGAAPGAPAPVVPAPAPGPRAPSVPTN